MLNLGVLVIGQVNIIISLLSLLSTSLLYIGANCFITHHCASTKQKNKIIDRAIDIPNTNNVEPLFIETF